MTLQLRTNPLCSPFIQHPLQITSFVWFPTPDYQCNFTSTCTSNELYLQCLKSQVPLLNLDCDLSSLNQWAGDEAFEIKMSDKMLDELVQSMSRKVQSENEVADKEKLICLCRLSELGEHCLRFKQLNTCGLSKLQAMHDHSFTYYPCFNQL